MVVPLDVIITNFLQAEVVFLGQLRHPNLVKLIGYCCEDEDRLLVYEFMPRGSLENHLFRSKYEKRKRERSYLFISVEIVVR